MQTNVGKTLQLHVVVHFSTYKPDNRIEFEENGHNI